MTGSELAFLALGLLLGAATGAALACGPRQPPPAARDSAHRGPRCRSPPIRNAVTGRLRDQPLGARERRPGRPSVLRPRRCRRRIRRASVVPVGTGPATARNPGARFARRIERSFHLWLPRQAHGWESPSSPRLIPSSRTSDAARAPAPRSSGCFGASTGRWSRSSMRSPARTAGSVATGSCCSVASSRPWPSGRQRGRHRLPDGHGVLGLLHHRAVPARRRGPGVDGLRYDGESGWAESRVPSLSRPRAVRRCRAAAPRSRVAEPGRDRRTVRGRPAGPGGAPGRGGSRRIAPRTCRPSSASAPGSSRTSGSPGMPSDPDDRLRSSRCAEPRVGLGRLLAGSRRLRRLGLMCAAPLGRRRRASRPRRRRSRPVEPSAARRRSAGPASPPTRGSDARPSGSLIWLAWHAARRACARSCRDVDVGVGAFVQKRYSRRTLRPRPLRASHGKAIGLRAAG